MQRLRRNWSFIWGEVYKWGFWWNLGECTPGDPFFFWLHHYWTGSGSPGKLEFYWSFNWNFYLKMFYYWLSIPLPQSCPWGFQSGRRKGTSAVSAPSKIMSSRFLGSAEDRGELLLCLPIPQSHLWGFWVWQKIGNFCCLRPSLECVPEVFGPADGGEL